MLLVACTGLYTASDAVLKSIIYLGDLRIKRVMEHLFLTDSPIKIKIIAKPAISDIAAFNTLFT